MELKMLLITVSCSPTSILSELLQIKWLLLHCCVSLSTPTLPQCTVSDLNFQIQVSGLQIYDQIWGKTFSSTLKHLCRERNNHNQDTAERTQYPPSPPALFGVSQRGSHVRLFLPPDGQSAPCSQPLSSHFTRSTRWKPRELLFFRPFRLSAAERGSPVCEWQRQQGSWHTNKYLSAHTLQPDPDVHWMSISKSGKHSTCLINCFFWHLD